MELNWEDQNQVSSYKKFLEERGVDTTGFDDFVQQKVGAKMAPQVQQEQVMAPQAQQAMAPQTQKKELPYVTQPYGNYNPQIEKYSGGVNLGTDFRSNNEPLMAPRGNWVVEKAAGGWNDGSGNLVIIKNQDTGESIAYEHLGRIGVRKGQKLKPGMVIGLSGATGNVTGPHASLPYKTGEGQYQDIRSTPYVYDIF